MSISTTSYYPWDQHAPSIFRSAQTSNYVNFASLMLLLYDHVITLDKEVEWIWTLRWRLPKIIFIVNRYIFPPLLMVVTFSALIFPLSTSFCIVNLYLALCLPLLIFGAAEILIVIRVCSLYGHHKFVTGTLSCLFAVALIGSIVTQTLFGRGEQVALFYEFLPGCWMSSLNGLPQWHVWVCFLSVEVVFMFLTAYKLLSYRNQLMPTIAVLARDSIVYFVIVFVCLVLVLAYDVSPYFTIDIEILSQCITSIAVGRMMMNIRGLILDDPEHTTHLQTLQFAVRTHSDTEIELDARVP